MKKIFCEKKHWLCLLLSLCLIISVLPVLAGSAYGAAAQNNGEGNYQLRGDNMTISRAQWIQSLVTTFNMTVEEETAPDNYFSDLTGDEDYYRDILVAVSFGVVDIEEGLPFRPAEPTTREFAAQTLNACLSLQLGADAEYTFAEYDSVTYPDDIQIAINRGWFALQNGSFFPNKAITSEECNVMFADAAAILEEKAVDPNYNSTYTYTVDVIEVPMGTEVSVDVDNNVTIADCPVEIQSGDVFVVYFGGIPFPYAAQSVEQEDNLTVIHAVEIDGEDVFSDIDAQGSVETEFTQFVPYEGTEVEFINEITGERFTDAIEAERSVKNAAATATRGVVNIKRSVSIKQKVKLSDVTSASISFTLKDPKLEYKLITSTKTAMVTLTGKKEVSIKVEADVTDAVAKKEIQLLLIGVKGIGGLEVSVVFDLSGSATATWSGNLCESIMFSPYTGITRIQEYNAESFFLELEATFKAGVRVSLGINDFPMDVIAGNVYVEAGAKGSVKKTNYVDDELPRSCVHTAIYLYLEYGATAHVKFGPFKTEASYKAKVWTDKNSPLRVVHHYEDGVEVAQCTRGGSDNNGYYTNSSSNYGSTGWSGGNNGYGVDANGNPVLLFTYTVDDEGDATITGYLGNSSSLSIPEAIDGHTVVAIGNNAFKGRSTLCSIIISTSIERIGDQAFLNCTSLSSVLLPDTLQAIGKKAFAGCSSLGAIVFPGNLNNIGSEAFANCVALNYVYVPISVSEGAVTYTYNTTFDNAYGIFHGCSSLSTIEFEEGTTTIHGGMFAGSGLKRIVIPNSVTLIGPYAFAFCGELEYLNLPDNLSTIGEHAFWYCSKLDGITLPSRLSTIGGEAFGQCTSLSSINIPLSVTQGAITFSYNTVVDNAYGIFNGCTNLTDVEFESGTTLIRGGLFAGSGIKEIVIPETVTQIGWYAFAFCKNLYNVTFPNNLTAIGEHAFWYCESITDLSFPQKLSSIGEEAFGHCINLKSVYIPISVSTGGISYVYNQYSSDDYCRGIFNACSSLDSVTFESGTTVIHAGIFAGSGLSSIDIPETVVFIGPYAFAFCNNLQQVSFPDALTSIRDRAFWHCNSLTSAVLPDSISEMGYGVFQHATGLTTAKLPQQLDSVPSSTFYNCVSLNTVIMPSSPQTISSSAFYNCKELSGISLGDSLISIGDSAFYNCLSLNDVVLPSSLKKIDSKAFYGCKGLSAISIPDSVTSLGSNLFSYCTNLSAANLGTGMTKIPDFCFYECSNLNKIVLPYRVTKIGAKAFGNCTGLTEATILRNVTEISSDAFSYPDILTIYGVSGTYAETYAGEIGAAFVPIDVPATDVSLNENSLRLAKGASFQLIPSITPANFTDATAWKSNNTDVATVTDDGLVKAVGIGEATISFVVGNKKATCSVTVVQPVTSISLNKTSLSMNAGEAFQLIATVSPSNAENKEIEWSTSDETIAAVDQSGLVHALKKGTATVTATAKDGSGTYRTCAVTVLNDLIVVTSVDDLQSPILMK